MLRVAFWQFKDWPIIKDFYGSLDGDRKIQLDMLLDGVYDSMHRNITWKQVMRVFYCVDFEGVYPTGTAAVVVAETYVEARQYLDQKLTSKRLKIGSAELVEIDTNTKQSIILCDGDY